MTTADAELTHEAAVPMHTEELAADGIAQESPEPVPTEHLNGHLTVPAAPPESDAAPGAEPSEVEPPPDRRKLVEEAADRLAAMPTLDRDIAIGDELAGLKGAGVPGITKAGLERAAAAARKQAETARKAARRERRHREVADVDSDPFAPLTPEELAEGYEAEDSATFAVVPVPDDATKPPTRHPKLGKPVRRFAYRNAAGELLGYVERFKGKDGGKELRPRFHGSLDGAPPRWHRRYPARPRPLFGLDLLAARPGAPVLVCEGEKAAGAAATADWSPLAGRDVTIWPDRDDAGAGYAEKVAGNLWRIGVARVRVVEVPGWWPEGWDLSDQPSVGVTPDTIGAMLAAAPEHRLDADRQGAFLIAFRRHREPELGITLEPGIYRQVERRDSEGTFKEWQRLGSLIEIAAYTRDGAGRAWGRLLRIHTPDGTVHEWAVPMEMMAGDGAEYRRELLNQGFQPTAGNPAKAGLQDFLASWRPGWRARCVDRCGWHGTAFVLPGRVVGPQPEPVVLQATRPAKLETRGTLEGWRRGVAALAVGNSRLIFAISLGFAGPLLHLGGETSGGFTEVGASSIGKSTLLLVAASVAGAAVLTWRATGNGLEAVAAGHNDLTLNLDELGQATPADLEVAAYMLGNGTGKARMQRTVTARDNLTWCLALYASGEVGLAAKLGEAGRRPRAGQEVRLVDLAADAGAGLGVFEELHGDGGGDTFARHLAAVTEEHRGVALVAFLEKLTADVEASRELVREGRRRFAQAVVPAGADGQVHRVAGRMGLVAAAGEIAAAHGLTGWSQGGATAAVERRFREWLAARGGPVRPRIARRWRRCGGSSSSTAWRGSSRRGRTNRRQQRPRGSAASRVRSASSTGRASVASTRTAQRLAGAVAGRGLQGLRPRPRGAGAGEPRAAAERRRRERREQRAGARQRQAAGLRGRARHPGRRRSGRGGAGLNARNPLAGLWDDVFGSGQAGTVGTISNRSGPGCPDLPGDEWGHSG